MKWEPIETAPEAEPILIYDPDPGGVHTVWGTRDSGGRMRWNFAVNYQAVTIDHTYGDPVFEPTHWMPLPEPPAR